MNPVLAELRSLVEKFAEHEHCGLAIGANQMPKVTTVLNHAMNAISDLERMLDQAINEKENAMGRAADAITQLQGQLSTAATTNSTLQSQLATAQANAYDSADISAINNVLGPPPTANASTASSAGPVGQVDLSSPGITNGSAGAVSGQ